MPNKKHKPEEIIGKLREVEIALAQGASTAEACRLYGESTRSQVAVCERRLLSETVVQRAGSV
ncbi:transposase [Sphingobium amiense]|uniref:transposase n=1 Tax=Sphingobium amiense TaxID=135719 RepID=UPI0008306BF5|nr:transposase [Sphingobium amiense]